MNDIKKGIQTLLLGTSEKAGSGVDKILEGWKFLGWEKPEITEHTRPDYVQLVLKVVQPSKKTQQENPIRNDETPQDNPIRTNKTQQEAGKKEQEKSRESFCVRRR